MKLLSIKLTSNMACRATFWNGWLAIPERALIFVGFNESADKIDSLLSLSQKIRSSYNKMNGYLRINEEHGSFQESAFYAAELMKTEESHDEILPDSCLA